jgi:geranyl-CoA carboxylase alpha subunit
MTSEQTPRGGAATPGPLDTLLVANRGEIALRILRSAHALGLATVAVYSEADAGMPHVLAADQAVCLGPAAAAESYLNIARLIDAAQRTGARLIHPGYGFLSESDSFAAACAAAGLVFIGPSPKAVRAMAYKAEAKRIMREAFVPCIPGYDGEDQDPNVLAREAARIGFPVMIKAIAGGGGKGMRLVASAAQLDEALRGARREAERAFGDGALMLEKAVLGARHVEVQVFGDRFGHVIHLGDRDCSIQRRHQKLIEEAPAPGLSPGLREAMAAAAIQAARAVNYEGAGTVEFLVTPEQAFFFLEMNTRLQVEHPVTEAITGLDLVQWQIRIARGEKLPLSQDQVRLSGHAMEARVCAESPAEDFLPQSGRLAVWQPPEGEGIRVDQALFAGAEVSTYYDSMIAKVIASGDSREVARQRLVRALRGFAIAGVRSNLGFLGQCLRHPSFAALSFDTGFIATHMGAEIQPLRPDRQMIAAAAALFHDRSAACIEPTLRNWRSRPSGERRHGAPIRLAAGDWRGEVRLAAAGDGALLVQDDAGEQRLMLLGGSPPRLRIDGVDVKFSFAWQDEVLQLVRGDRWFGFSEARQRIGTKATDAAAVVYAPMPGNVTEIRVAPGARVEAGEVLAILEAMKMEHQLLAPVAGILARLDVAVGQQVTMRQSLMQIVAMAETGKPG